MGLKILNSDGTTGEIELPEGAKLDTKSMGIMSQEEVGAFKIKQREQGKLEALERVNAIEAEKNALMNKIQTLENSMSNKDKEKMTATEQLTKLHESFEGLKSQYEKSESIRRKAEFKDELRRSIEGVTLVPDAFDLLATDIDKKRNDSGFVNKLGETTDLKTIVAEWLESPIGKALKISSEKGGAGSSDKTFQGESFESYYKAGKNADYIGKYGQEKFQEQLFAYKQRKKNTT